MEHSKLEDDLAQYYFATLNSSTGDHPKEKGFLLPDVRCHGVYIDITGEELEKQLQSCRNEIISKDDLIGWFCDGVPNCK